VHGPLDVEPSGHDRTSATVWFTTVCDGDAVTASESCKGRVHLAAPRPSLLVATSRPLSSSLPLDSNFRLCG
jgi:hypothetical protein